MKRRPIIIFLIILAILILIALTPYLVPIISGLQPKNISAWISEPGQASSVSSITKHGYQLTSVSPMWYKIDENGKLAVAWADDGRIKKAARERGVLLLPTISNHFDPKRSNIALANAARRRRLIDDIVKLVDKNHYDGIDLDFENLLPGDERRYTGFVTSLRQPLTAIGAVLSVTVQPKTKYSKNWPGTKAHNYRDLGRVADQVRVMAYDQHYSSGSPGPVAAIYWVRLVVKYASHRIPADKLILGVPLYGYDWSEPGKAQAVDYRSALEIARDFHTRVKWDPKAASPYFSYQSGGKDHIVWFENARSTRAKLDIKGSEKLAGFSFFRLGIEDQKIWQEIGKRFYPTR